MAFTVSTNSWYPDSESGSRVGLAKLMRLNSCAIIRRSDSSPRQLLLRRSCRTCFTGARRSS
eukprot:1190276-Prorocentrum_minimum.AAC.2